MTGSGILTVVYRVYVACSRLIKTPRSQPGFHKSYEDIPIERRFYDDWSSVIFARPMPGFRHGHSAAGMPVDTPPLTHAAGRLMTCKYLMWSGTAPLKRRTPVSGSRLIKPCRIMRFFEGLRAEVLTAGPKRCSWSHVWVNGPVTLRTCRQAAPCQPVDVRSCFRLLTRSYLCAPLSRHLNAAASVNDPAASAAWKLYTFITNGFTVSVTLIAGA